MKIPGFPSFSHENQLAKVPKSSAVAARTAAAAQHAQQGTGWA